MVRVAPICFANLLHYGVGGALSDEDVEDEEPLAALRARAEATDAAAPGRVGGGA